MLFLDSRNVAQHFTLHRRMEEGLSLRPQHLSWTEISLTTEPATQQQGKRSKLNKAHPHRRASDKAKEWKSRGSALTWSMPFLLRSSSPFLPNVTWSPSPQLVSRSWKMFVSLSSIEFQIIGRFTPNCNQVLPRMILCGRPFINAFTKTLCLKARTPTSMSRKREGMIPGKNCSSDFINRHSSLSSISVVPHPISSSANIILLGPPRVLFHLTLSILL